MLLTKHDFCITEHYTVIKVCLKGVIDSQTTLKEANPLADQSMCVYVCV